MGTLGRKLQDTLGATEVEMAEFNQSLYMLRDAMFKEAETALLTDSDKMASIKTFFEIEHMNVTKSGIPCFIY
jgi:hypothetical protein